MLILALLLREHSDQRDRWGGAFSDFSSRARGALSFKQADLIKIYLVTMKIPNGKILRGIRETFYTQTVDL